MAGCAKPQTLNCRQRRSIVSVAEYETDRESLRRMLADFQDDYLAKHKVVTRWYW